jgi:hypothetical protein
MTDWNNFKMKLVECITQYSKIINFLEFEKSISDNIEYNSELYFDLFIENISLIISKHTKSLFLNKEFTGKFNNLFIEFGLIDQETYNIPKIRVWNYNSNESFWNEPDYESYYESDCESVRDVCNDCDKYLKGGGTCKMCNGELRKEMIKEYC